MIKQLTLALTLTLVAQSATGFGGQLTSPGGHGPTPFSGSGLIHGIPGGHTTMPGWHPGAHYAQRPPRPIFATGTELNAGDCQVITFNIIRHECSLTPDNCRGAQLHQIRPAILRQLSAIPGHNFITACGGFIDGAWAEFQRDNQGVPARPAHGMPTQFPAATGGAGTATGGGQLITQNPFERHLPLWMEEFIERSEEMGVHHRAQQHTVDFRPTQMPGHISDISLTERIQLTQAGMADFAPAFDAQGNCIRNCAFHTIRIESDLDMFTRVAAEEAARCNAIRFTDTARWCAECQVQGEFNRSLCCHHFASNSPIYQRHCAAEPGPGSGQDCGPDYIRDLWARVGGHARGNLTGHNALDAFLRGRITTTRTGSTPYRDELQVSTPPVQCAELRAFLASRAALTPTVVPPAGTCTDEIINNLITELNSARSRYSGCSNFVRSATFNQLPCITQRARLNGLIRTATEDCRQ